MPNLTYLTRNIMNNIELWIDAERERGELLKEEATIEKNHMAEHFFEEDI